MNGSQLSAFVLVVERRSFTRAAARLGVSQPTATARIKTLENELGCKLLERRPDGVVPTIAGEDLLPIARQILELLRAAELAVRASRASSSVAIGVSDDLVSRELVPLVEYVCHRYQSLELILREMPVEEAIRGVRSGELDCAVYLDVYRDLTNLETVALREEPLALIRPAKDVNTAEDAAWVRSSDGSAWQQEVDFALADNRQASLRSVTLPSMGAAKRTVAQGVGLTVLPASIASAELASGALTQVVWASPVRTFINLSWDPATNNNNADARQLVLDAVERIFAH